jgi:hypothetical protein
MQMPSDAMSPHGVIIPGCTGADNLEIVDLIFAFAEGTVAAATGTG